MEDTKDTNLVELLLKPMTKCRAFRKRCSNEGCQDQGPDGQLHGALEELRPEDLHELLVQVGRFHDKSSVKNRASVALPEWLFPIPGVKALYYVKAIVVHDGRQINGGHYFAYAREGPMEAERAQDELEAAGDEGDDGDDGDEGVGEETFGVANISIDDDIDEEERSRRLNEWSRKRQAENRRQQVRREEKASFQLWKKFEDDKMTARIPWSTIEVSVALALEVSK